MTLVIDPDATPVRTLWAHMLTRSLPDACEALCEREGIPKGHCKTKIGCWPSEDAEATSIPLLKEWAEARGLGGVIWTALKPKFNNIEKRPSLQEVVAYLDSLRGPKREHARYYVEHAPRQIDTEFRREIEAALGWSCLGSRSGTAAPGQGYSLS